MVAPNDIFKPVFGLCQASNGWNDRREAIPSSPFGGAAVR